MSNGPMRIRLSEEGRSRMLDHLRALFHDEFDRELSEFQLERLLDFVVEHLGPPVYNQAVQDARTFLQEKLDDLEGELYEPISSG